MKKKCQKSKRIKKEKKSTKIWTIEDIIELTKDLNIHEDNNNTPKKELDDREKNKIKEDPGDKEKNKQKKINLKKNKTF